ncbi:hypothetical protein [Streptomyces sp. NPDC090057]|uniref:hypothetical protein n=1 Tax=Streptomyces sp. NPDC090057 TaxID=3365935 RepID=UPI003802D97E
MPTWGLVVETTVGVGKRKHMEAQVVAHVAGPREEALAELERRARFTVAELLEDSADTAPPEPVPEELPAPAAALEPAGKGPIAPVAEEKAERYADGVPVRPSWLGRTDLA